MKLEHLQHLADELRHLWQLGPWTIIVQWLPEEEREYEGNLVYGDCTPHGASETCHIRINPEASDYLQRHTLYHEMTHLRLEGHDCQSFYERGVDVLSGLLCR